MRRAPIGRYAVIGLYRIGFGWTESTEISKVKRRCDGFCFNMNKEYKKESYKLTTMWLLYKACLAVRFPVSSL